MSAHDAVNLRCQIRVAAAARSPAEILGAMGYRRITPARRERLERVLADELLGLGSGGFDFRYDARGYVNALCQALDLDAEIWTHVVDAIADRAARRRAFAPFIVVETDFKRTTQSIFVIALMEGRRTLVFPVVFRDRSPIEQLRQAGETVTRHYQDHDGQLMFWGRILRYRFFYAPGAQAIFDVSGCIERFDRAASDAGAVHAYMTLGGQAMTPLIP